MPFQSAPSQPTPSQLVPSQPVPPQYEAGTNFTELCKKIKELKGRFENLVQLMEDSFPNERISLRRIQNSAKNLPASLMYPTYYFTELTSTISNSESVRQLFMLLSRFWDYLNPKLLEYFVGRFGSPEHIALMHQYNEKLEEFRKVRINDFIAASQGKDLTITDYSISCLVTVMGEEWEEKTLQDVEDYRTEMCKESSFKLYVSRANPQKSSIAIVFSMPRSIQINIKKLEPFFYKKKVLKVFPECLILDQEESVRGQK